MALAEREELLARMKETREELLSLLASMSLTEESASQPTKADAQGNIEGQWSVKQQLAHMAETERLWVGWALQVKNGAAQVGPVQNAPDGQISGSQFTAHSHLLADLLDQLASARAWSLQVIASVPDDDLGKKAYHGTSGEMTILQMLRALYRHHRMHTDQIAGRESAFQPRTTRPS